MLYPKYLYIENMIAGKMHTIKNKCKRQFLRNKKYRYLHK